MQPDPPFVSIYATAGSDEEARRIARILLERRLAACANLFPITSLYWWKGAIEEGAEVGILLKTRAELAEAAVAALREAHSYEVPCAVVFPWVGAHGAYAAWVASETRGPPPG